VTKNKHTTVRLSDEARERLDRLASDYSSATAAIEDALTSLESSRLAFGRQVWQATSALIDAVQSGDDKAIGGAQIKLAELLHSLPAAIGITSALRETLGKEGAG
jgi:predicted transcriptional regulator